MVAITANALEEQLAECFIAGMQDVLVKPFNRDQVTGVIATYGNPKMLKGPP